MYLLHHVPRLLREVRSSLPREVYPSPPRNDRSSRPWGHDPSLPKELLLLLRVMIPAFRRLKQGNWTQYGTCTFSMTNSQFNLYHCLVKSNRWCFFYFTQKNRHWSDIACILSPENRLWHCMQLVCLRRMSMYIFWVKWKKKSKISSADFLSSIQSFKNI